MNETKTHATHKKTPLDASEFEREQLKFFLSSKDLAATLAEFNPSLAWLPMLWDMRLIEDGRQLAPWIERNFSKPQAIRDVVANIKFFGPEMADDLEFRLNAHSASLEPLFAKCWRLIVRHMRDVRRGISGTEWFEISPQVKRGDHSIALLQRIADILRPKLRIKKRLALRQEESDKVPQTPFDLMSIEYEADGNASASDIIDAWPRDASPKTDEALLAQLMSSLKAALEDATDVGVETNDRYSASDSDVPSIAESSQNDYHAGFQLTIRVIVEVWSRLLIKSESTAVAIANQWHDSPFRLVQRLALFAFANPALPSDSAADLLLKISSAELFLTNSSVEVYRLIRSRWNEFSSTRREEISRRICDGPPRDSFREESDIDLYVDHARFELLSDMAHNGLHIGTEARRLLEEISARYPQWQPRPSEQAGFHVWHGSGGRESDNETDKLSKLKDVADADLVAKAESLAAPGDCFRREDVWQELCLRDPDRAARGLTSAFDREERPGKFWSQLLWCRSSYIIADTEGKIANCLLQWPVEEFSAVAVAASSWFDNHSKTLSDDLVWPLWDRIADAVMTERSESADG